jgi:hypothetical protein
MYAGMTRGSNADGYMIEFTAQGTPWLYALNQDTCVVAGPGSVNDRTHRALRGLVESGVTAADSGITFTEKATKSDARAAGCAFADRPDLTPNHRPMSTVHGLRTRLLRENAILAGVIRGSAC